MKKIFGALSCVLGLLCCVYTIKPSSLSASYESLRFVYNIPRAAPDHTKRTCYDSCWYIFASAERDIDALYNNIEQGLKELITTYNEKIITEKISSLAGKLARREKIEDFYDYLLPIVECIIAARQMALETRGVIIRSNQRIVELIKHVSIEKQKVFKIEFEKKIIEQRNQFYPICYSINTLLSRVSLIQSQYLLL